MTAYEAYLIECLKRASQALDASVKLLDIKFGKGSRWRNECPIADDADNCRLNAFGWADYDAAKTEAERCNALGGKRWSVWADPTGAWRVRPEE